MSNRRTCGKQIICLQLAMACMRAARKLWKLKNFDEQVIGFYEDVANCFKERFGDIDELN